VRIRRESVAWSGRVTKRVYGERAEFAMEW